jgi:hypothetical protein
VGLNLVPGYAIALDIQIPEVALREGISLLGGAPIPQGGARRVPGDPVADFMTAPQGDLGIGVASACGVEELGEGLVRSRRGAGHGR